MHTNDPGYRAIHTTQMFECEDCNYVGVYNVSVVDYRTEFRCNDCGWINEIDMTP